MEAVFGAEQYKARESYPARAPWHNSVLPFTRNVIGPMDFTPVTFSDAKYPHKTTNAHELALSVVFENPIQHFADSVASYRATPPQVKTFLKQVPAAWDETRFLSGDPGDKVVVARRDRGVWYVGGITGRDSEQMVNVPLDFLKEGTWRGMLIQDGATDRLFEARATDQPVKPDRVVGMQMRLHGGFVMRFERADGPPRGRANPAATR
jgi:hypothetical protein